MCVRLDEARQAVLRAGTKGTVSKLYGCVVRSLGRDINVRVAGTGT